MNMKMDWNQMSLILIRRFVKYLLFNFIVMYMLLFHRLIGSMCFSVLFSIKSKTVARCERNKIAAISKLLVVCVLTLYDLHLLKWYGLPVEMIFMHSHCSHELLECVMKEYFQFLIDFIELRISSNYFVDLT